MRRNAILIICLLLITVSCKQKNRDKSNPEVSTADTTYRHSSTPELRAPPGPEDVVWSDSNKVEMAIDTNLRFNNFRCDSAIIVGYEGTFGEVLYMPLNNSGQWIGTVWKKKKLTQQQLIFFKTLIGNSSAYEDMDTNWYHPEIGLVFFRKGKVVAQSAFSYGGDKIAIRNMPGYNGSDVIYNKKISHKLKLLFNSIGLVK